MTTSTEQFQFVYDSVIKKYHNQDYNINKSTMIKVYNILYDLINDNYNSDEKINNFFINTVNNQIKKFEDSLNGVSDDDFLRIFIENTQNYYKLIYYLIQLFKYLERIYLLPKNKPLLGEIAYKSYFNNIFYVKKMDLYKSMSHIITRDRLNRNTSVETGNLYTACYKILKNVFYQRPLLIKDDDGFHWEENSLFEKKNNVKIEQNHLKYIKEFMNDLQNKNSECTEIKFKKIFKKCDFAEYVQILSDIIEEETTLITLYLPSDFHESELESLKKNYINFSSELIENFEETYFSFLEQKDHENLININKNIYPYSNYLKKKIPQIIEKHIGKSIKNIRANPLLSKNPLKLIPPLLKIKGNYDNMIKECLFAKEINNVKQNAFVKNLNEEFYAIQLSNFIDYLMKNRASNIFKNNEEMENCFDNIASLHSCINSKLIFELEMMKKLTNRLLYNKSLSLELEKKILKKIKENCDITNMEKMESMINDIEINSPQLMLEYKKSKEFLTPMFNFNVKCISQTNFSIPKNKIFNIDIPQNLNDYILSYNDFYSKTFSNRKLTWCYGYCTVEIKYLYLSREFISSSSFIQYSILLTLEKFNKLTITKISEYLGINSYIIINEINGLIFNKAFNPNNDCNKGVLIGDFKDIINENNEVQLNYNFKHNSIKFQTIKSYPENKKEEIKDEQQKIKMENNILQSTITRIMKSKAGQSVNHNWLINKVKQEVTQFLAQPPQIKIQIEKLIELNIIKRDEYNINSYIYLA